MRAPASSTRSSSRQARSTIEQRQQRHAEDAAVVVEAPVLLEPAVERAQLGVGVLGVVAHRVLDAHGEGRQQDRGFDALLVHQREASVAILVGVEHVLGARTWIAYALRSGSRRFASSEPGGFVLSNFGLGEHVRPVVEHDAVVAVVVCLDPQRARRGLALDVAGESVARLVVVVVGVDRPVVEGAHDAVPLVSRVGGTSRR